jgi:hypothetical protein
MSKLSYKKYRCKECGAIKEIQTNHYGECYSAGHYNTCTAWPCKCAAAPFYNPTTWECLEKPNK